MKDPVSCSPSQVSKKPGFWRDEDGSFTVEAVIWIPLFAMILAFIMNVSMLFFAESQMLRIVQDGNRALSLGRLESVEEVEQYVLARLTYLNVPLNIDTQVSGGFVSTNVSVTAADLMPLKLMTAPFQTVSVAVFAQHIIEF